MKRSRRSAVLFAAVVVVVLSMFAAASAARTTTRSAEVPTFTVGIDIPFHPIFNYVYAKADEYFANKPYKVKFKFLDATTQVPAFGKGEIQVMTTPPSFIPRVMDQYKLRVAEFFPLARWTIGPQILVKKDSQYKKLADLQGKRVAVPPLKTRFGSEEASIMAVTGQNIRTYFKLRQTEAAAQELTLGRVDAAFIEAPTTFPLLQSGNFKAIWSVHDGFLKAFGDPAVVNGGYIARVGFIAGNRGFINDLIAASQDAWDKYQQDPKAVNDVASKISGVPPEQLLVVGQVLNLDKMPRSLRVINQRDVRTWTKIFPLLKKSGFNNTTPKNPAALFVVTKPT